MTDPNPLVLKLSQSGLLTPAERDTLERATAIRHTVKRDTVLLEQGEQSDKTPVIMSGLAYRYKLLPEGNRQILGLLVPGDSCDVQGPMLSRSDHGTATAIDSEIVWWSRETIDGLTLADTRIARALWWATLVDESILRTWLTNMGQRDASKWMAHFLCEYLLRHQVVGLANGNSCWMPLLQQEIADILGITTVHVSRTLKDLRDAGLIELVSRRLTVPDTRALWAFCGFDPGYLHLKPGAGQMN